MLGILRRVFSFADWTQHHPMEPPPGDMLDASFDAQDQKISELEGVIADLRRSDGALRNGIVTVDSLSPELRAGLRIPAAKAASNGDELGFRTAEATADVWAHASADWAEHMPDTIPEDSVAVMDITGDHWSSRWWAHQALLNVAAGVPGAPGPPGGARIEYGDVLPPSPNDSEIFWESDTGALYLWYVDPSGPPGQWVQISSAPGNVVVTPQMFGAKGDGITNDTVALQAAAASGYDVYVPAGRYLVRDMSSILNGRTWQGAGRTRSVIYVPNTFNLAALGVLRLGTAEPGASLFDIGFEFQQDTTVTTRAAVVHYPPAIYARDVPRCQIDRVRISSAWDGIDASGNFGGSYIGRIEVGALNRGLLIDGAKDFVHGESWHFWPFGMAGTALYTSVYADGTTVACELGRADFYAIDKIGAFQCIVKLNATNVTLGTHNVAALQLDGNGSRLVCTNIDNWSFGNIYSSKGAAAFGPDISLAAAGRIRIGCLWTAGTRTGPAILASNGTLAIDGGFLSQTDITQQCALVSSSGRLEIRDCTMGIPSAARTVPYIEQTGGALIFKDNNVETPAGSGPLVKLATDVVTHDVSSNHFSGLSLVVPAGAVLGRYGPNRVAALSFTPVLTFTTPGDLAYTATAANGRYYWETNGYRFSLRLVISGAITYTTASGSMLIGGLPAQHKGLDASSLNVSRWAKLDLGAGYTDIGASISVNTDYVQLTRQGDNVALGTLTVTHIPTGTTGFEITIDGFIPSQ